MSKDKRDGDRKPGERRKPTPRTVPRQEGDAPSPPPVARQSRNTPPSTARVSSSNEIGIAELLQLFNGEHPDPHHILGAHASASGNTQGVVVRAFHPDASAVQIIQPAGGTVSMAPIGRGLFSAFIAGAALPLRYRLRFHFPSGGSWERGDPYRFLPSLGDIDLHLFNEGTHHRLWEKLGAHPRRLDGDDGVAFAVWAPTARRVSVVGEFNNWDGRLFPMRRLGASGVWELFLPGVGTGELYKYEILTRDGASRIKTDPFAFAMEAPPQTASRVVKTDDYEWADAAWMERRATRDHAREPMLIYEVHPGSWMRSMDGGGRFLSFRELAPKLVAHCSRLGFTHVELLPVMEHPFYGSWGYQVSGYYAPSSRFGTPDDFRFLVDALHQAEIGVILDWVPAHFPKDDFALRRFDGSALYEHEDPRLGEHPDWGTLIFNYGRNEVRNFLIANALYWLSEFHCDGLRVDAVASMLYLDYSRQPGQWLRNRFGGRENLDAIEFLKQMNEAVRSDQPGCFTVAEESTSWPGVTHPVREGGLGFTFKWNMGWMHDTLDYFSYDPIYRSFHHNEITFGMMYEYSERFVNPISHDEVVHLKRSLIEKMPGDEWQKLANLRLLVTYQITRPGKALLFMSSELAPHGEWNHDVSLDWHLTQQPERAGLDAFFETLGTLYRHTPALWKADPDPDGFCWIDADDRVNSVFAYARFSKDLRDRHVIVVMNCTPVPRSGYRIGVPSAVTYEEIFSSDDPRFFGSAVETVQRVVAEPVPYHGFAQSIVLTLPPLGAVLLSPAASGDADIAARAAL
ncbi:MAG: 1,4-alpha-glucan branching protein GlgB [Gemmatimonadota bacterium]|nr:1,4-alpha-glucan branching protein GlgB [Gemmatimonadota bacterium]